MLIKKQLNSFAEGADSVVRQILRVSLRLKSKAESLERIRPLGNVLFRFTDYSCNYCINGVPGSLTPNLTLPALRKYGIPLADIAFCKKIWTNPLICSRIIRKRD
jgi:hypothetical protein